MDAIRCADANQFLDATLAYRGAEPLRTNVLGSVATTAAHHPVRRAEPFWWVVRDTDGSVLGAAMRTDPFPLSLGPMPGAAAAALAAAVAVLDDDLPAVAGAAAAVEAFLAAYATTGTQGAARVVTSTHRQLLYAADHVVVPDVEGESSVATVDELDLAERWHADFTHEVDGVRLRPSDDDRATLRVVVETGRLRWWRRDGEIVSMAGHAVPVVTPVGAVTRVGPVYTPPEQRGHGYAAVLTGRLTELLLAGGSQVMLYADAANPTSNGVYRSLGYEVVDELVRAGLSAP